MTLTTYALWGAGDLDPRSAAVILSEYMPDPDDVGDIYRPDRVPREHKGLRAAQDYLESDAYAGQSLSPSTDVLASLKDARDTEGDDVVLLALWPEAPTREDFAFIRLFEAEGIPVRDLSRTLDDLDLSLYTEPEPPKEPRKSRAKTKLSDSLKDEDFVSPSMETAATEMVVQTAPLYAVDTLSTVALAEKLGPETFELLDEYINAKIRLAMVHRTEPIAGTILGDAMLEIEDAALRNTMQRAAETGLESVPFDGPYVGIDTQEYYSDREGNVRPAVGKFRRGEFVVNLTEDEVAKAQEEGRLNG